MTLRPKYGLLTCCFAPNSRSRSSEEMESEQDLREFQREYLEFLDEDVNNIDQLSINN